MSISNLEHGYLFMQGSSFSEFQPESNERAISNISSNPIVSSLDSLDLVDLQILKAVGEISTAKAADIEDRVHISRSALLKRTAKLAELNLLTKGTLPGTESKFKPTFTFSLDPDLTREEIESAISTLQEVKTETSKLERLEEREAHQSNPALEKKEEVNQPSDSTTMGTITTTEAPVSIQPSDVNREPHQYSQIDKTRPSTWAELVLGKFPEFDPSWSDEVKEKWFVSFERLIEMENRSG